MGLFGFGNKKPAEKQNPITPEETARRWGEAYRANPKVYGRKDTGALLGTCTLTETVDTILPLRPEYTWAADPSRSGFSSALRRSVFWGRWTIRRR